ncbi:MAG TPA: TIGR03067 domain-containing protein [Rhodanobacteraceae bacterium]|nr:TIGR03067 domain-containing protein [Rhodanobacteraceae bacterium]
MGTAEDEDLQALQGSWRQVAFEQDGVDDPPDTHGAPDSLTEIRGNRYTVTTVEGDVILEGSFVLDAGVTPHRITWTDDEGPRGHTSLTASYRIEGDRFAFIGSLDGPVPTEFKTGRGEQMRSFVRAR